MGELRLRLECSKPGAMAEVVKYADGVGPGWYMLSG